MNSPSNPSGLTQLGAQAPLPASPDQAVLERVANPHPGTLYLARFTAPEFTSLCPVTGQPDFAHLVIDYAPADWIVESKSLKLYLTSFRNHGAFHEDCTIAIGKRLFADIEPQFPTLVFGVLAVAEETILRKDGSDVLVEARNFICCRQTHSPQEDCKW